MTSKKDKENLKHIGKLAVNDIIDHLLQDKPKSKEELKETIKDLNISWFKKLLIYAKLKLGLLTF